MVDSKMRPVGEILRGMQKNALTVHEFGAKFQTKYSIH